MSEALYNKQDREIIKMVNKHSKDSSRVVGVILPASEVPALRDAEANLQKLYAEKLLLKRFGVAAGRCGLGLLCISAMVNGLMAPGLACVAALVCVVWAAAGYRRGGYGKA